MNKPKIVFFGSPVFSAEILDHIVKNPNFTVVGVVTNPDRPTGRHRTLTPSPVAQVAASHHLPTFKPTTLDENNRIHLSLLQADLLITAAYGKIIPDNWLKTPKLSALNVHFSLLPKYRGALCVSEALKNGDRETGVSLIEMDSELDHGPLIATITQNIDTDDDNQTLLLKLTDKAKAMLDEVLPLYTQWKLSQVAPTTPFNLQSTLHLPPQTQDHHQAVFTPSTSTRTRANALVPWEMIQNALSGNHPEVVHNLIRSLNPDPGAWSEIEEKTPYSIPPQGRDYAGQAKTQNILEIKILKTTLTDNKLKILEVQLPGKAPVAWNQFTAGHPEALQD